ncbi:MAG: hypothetical protein NXH72_14015 [Hyphomonadaceae bacterium]|nr:hypothetical protein [Hyphomonadaceae bacterium]
MIRSVSSFAILAAMASAFAATADTPAATVSNPVLVSVERGGQPLDITIGTQLQSGDVISLSNNPDIVVNNGLLTFGDKTCALTSGQAYTLDLGSGVAAYQAGAADVCGALLKTAPIQSAAAAAAAGGAGGGTAAAGGNAPLIIGGIVLAAGGIAAAAGGGDDGGTTPTSP